MLLPRRQSVRRMSVFVKPVTRFNVLNLPVVPLMRITVVQRLLAWRTLKLRLGAFRQ